MSSAAWLARNGGMVAPDRYPFDATDTELGPHVLRDFADFADASDDPRTQALASYVLRMNPRIQGHILDMCTDIDTAAVTGVYPVKMPHGGWRPGVGRMGPGVKAGTLEQFNDAIEALTNARDRLYPTHGEAAA